MASHYREVSLESVGQEQSVQGERWDPTDEDLQNITEQVVGASPFIRAESLQIPEENSGLKKEGVLGTVEVEGLNVPVALLGEGAPRTVDYFPNPANKFEKVKIPGINIIPDNRYAKSVTQHELSREEIGTQTLDEFYQSLQNLGTSEKKPHWAKDFLKALLPREQELQRMAEAAKEKRTMRLRQNRNQPVMA